MAPAQQRLILAVHQLRARVFSSLPWGYRVARFLVQIRFAAEPGAFGRLTYGLFMLYGVEGLPRVDFRPKTIREIDKLPRDFGREFGYKCRNVAAKYLRGSDDAIEELLSEVVVKLISSPEVKRVLSGEVLSRAESYVLKIIRNMGIDQLRKNHVRRHEDIDELIESPSHWDELGAILSESEKDDIAAELEKAVSPRLLPDLPRYFELLISGYSNKEIAEQRMLPNLREKPISQQALAKYRSKIREVLERHFEVQAGLLEA